MGADPFLVSSPPSCCSGSKPDWPKNGAVLKGEVVELDAPVQGCTKWLKVCPSSSSSAPINY